MAWAKGPQTGFGRKAEVLMVIPTAICYKKRSGSLVGYIVDEYEGGPYLGAAASSTRAWDKAHDRLMARGLTVPS